MRLIVVATLIACGNSSSPPPVPVEVKPDPVAKPDEHAEKMRHCPVTLAGVTTEVADVDGGIRFAMRATGDVAEELRRRAHALAKPREGGGGKGGGFMRNCPIQVKDTKLIATDVDGGVDVVVSPIDAANLVALRATARERMERAPLPRANVVREEKTDAGETRLFSGAAGDLDGDGTLELVAGGFTTTSADARRSTVRVYRQRGARWEPVAEAGWDGGNGSLIRNVEIGDVDGDGKLEVIAVGRVGPTPHESKARLAVFALVGGKLEKRAEIDWHAGGKYTHGYGLAIGDIDGDGKADIVTGGFQFDGTTELGYVRVWALRGGKLVLRAETTLDGQGSPQMRVNDLAIGDVDGDGKAEIVVAGRHGPLKGPDSKILEKRHEFGDLSVLSFAGDKLTTRARYSWSKGTSMRLRSIAVADLDGDKRAEIVAGGQYDADGKASLGLFVLAGDKLVLQHDASSTVAGVNGEVKDLLVVRRGADLRVLATGAIGEKPGRQGDLASWRFEGGALVREADIVSRNADDETRSRAVVALPGKGDTKVLTIGHAQNKSTMIGQVLEWQLVAKSL